MKVGTGRYQRPLFEKSFKPITKNLPFILSRHTEPTHFKSWQTDAKKYSPSEWPKNNFHSISNIIILQKKGAVLGTEKLYENVMLEMREL